MNYVLVESGVVIARDLTGNPPEGFIEAPADVCPGYLHDGAVFTAPPPPPPTDVVVLYPVDLWSRVTNAEAEQIEAAMATQSIRVQNIFRSASSYRSDHELWPLLESVAVGLFGSNRAREILATSMI